MEPTKRAKTNEGAKDEDRLKKLLAYIGDFGVESLVPHVTKLVSTVASLYETHQVFILHIFTECVCCLPHKAQIYAQVHSSLCAQLPSFHEDAVQVLWKKIVAATETGEIVRGKSAIRFLAYLARLRVGGVPGFVKCLETLLTAAQTPDACGYYGTLLVIGLFIAGEVIDPEVFTGLLMRLEDTRRARNVVWKLAVQVLKNVSDDHLDEGVRSLQALKERQWKSEVLSTYTVDSSSQLTIPELPFLTPKARYFPRFHLPFPVESPLSAPDLWYLTDLLSDLLHCFSGNSDLASEMILKLAEQTHSRNILGSVLASEVTNKLTPVPLVTFSTIAIRASAAGPEVVKGLEDSLSFFLKHAEHIDLETCERLFKFYSHVISNNQSAWNWSLIPEELSDAGLFFVKGLIADLARLIELDRLTAGLPERLHPYFPSPQDPILRYADIEESVENTDCQLIIDRIQSKATAQMMKALLTSKEICNSGDFLLQIFSECVFFHGAKSFLHVSTYLERYTDLMHTIKPEIILEALTEVWRNSAQRVMIICKKLLSMGLFRAEDALRFATQKIEAGDRGSDWNRCEWSLIEYSLKMMVLERGNPSPLQTVLSWASASLLRGEEVQRMKIKARLSQLFLPYRHSLTPEICASVPSDLAAYLTSLDALRCPL